ncbi:MAG: globin family protein [Pseudomonadota bacterium]
MKPDQIDVVQASFRKVVPIADAAAAMFYGRLFDIAPEVKPLFKGDMAEQGQKLMATLGVVVNGLRDLEKILPVAQGLAGRHVVYGVTPVMYKPVGEALIWTLEQGLGDAFTPEVKNAWIDAYTLISEAMVSSAYAEIKVDHEGSVS